MFLEKYSKFLVTRKQTNTEQADRKIYIYIYIYNKSEPWTSIVENVRERRPPTSHETAIARFSVPGDEMED